MTDDKAVDIHFDLVSCTPRIGISYMILFVRESRQVRQWLGRTQSIQLVSRFTVLSPLIVQRNLILDYPKVSTVQHRRVQNRSLQSGSALFDLLKSYSVINVS